MRRSIIWILVAASVTTILTSWLGPKVISWYFEPPVEIGVNCRSAVEWALAKLQLAQVSSLVGGAVIGLVLSLVFGRRDESAKQ